MGEKFQSQQSLPLTFHRKAHSWWATNLLPLLFHLHAVSHSSPRKHILTVVLEGSGVSWWGGLHSGSVTPLHPRQWPRAQLAELLIPPATSQAFTTTSTKHFGIFTVCSHITNTNLLLNYVPVREPFSPQKILLISDRASAGGRAERAA